MSEEFSSFYVVWKISQNEDNYFTSETTLVTFTTRYVSAAVVNINLHVVTVRISETDYPRRISRFRYTANANLYVKDAIEKSYKPE